MKAPLDLGECRASPCQSQGDKDHSHLSSSMQDDPSRCRFIFERATNSAEASRSLISDKSFTSAGISGALGTFSSSLRMSRFSARMMRNSTKAMMTKLNKMVRNYPYPRTAPCFLASA